MYMHQTLESVGSFFQKNIKVDCKIFYEWWKCYSCLWLLLHYLKDNDRSSHDLKNVLFRFDFVNL